MTVKFGVIGCGNIAKFHFNGLEKTGAEIVHIADLNEQAAKPWVEKFGAKYSKSYRALIDDKEVTVVSILTSSRFHREIAEAALDAGKDVICEKTMMDNAAEAASIVKRARESKRLFFTAYMKRCFPAAQKAKELIPSLGRLYSATVRVFQPWGGLLEATTIDEHLKKVINNYGGAIVKCGASHMLDMTLWLLGRPERLGAFIDFIPSSDFDRKATAIFEYADGMTASFEAAAVPGSKLGYERQGWDEYIEINGTEGRLVLSFVVWDRPERNAPLLTHYDNRTQTLTEHRFDIANPFDEEMKHFCTCLERREQGCPGVVDGFNVDALIEAMFEASRKKTVVEMDWRGL